MALISATCSCHSVGSTLVSDQVGEHLAHPRHSSIIGGGWEVLPHSRGIPETEYPTDVIRVCSNMEC